MNNEEDIFEAAAALPMEERSAYLDAACAGQPEMQARVEALLRSHDATGFMDKNAAAEEDSPALQAERTRSEPEEAGQQIGHYKLLEQIGEGGFGIVWVAEQLAPVRRRVAVKIIKPGMDSREIIGRFEQERQALAMMDHPNIAKVFDAGATDKGRPYFVMELVRGVKITDFCDQANLPTAERLKLFIAVCQAVQHAHQKGIIHRDLKPSNILVTPGDDGQPAPKVIDFGVAKAMQQSLTDETVYTQFEQMIGTPAYMSPEQAGLGPMDIDTRSDVYSLGVLLYELLTGRPPFDPKELLSAGLDEMRRVIREVEPPKPSTRRTQLLAAPGAGKHSAKSAIRSPKPKIDPDLDWIVMKALEKDRARRYETATGLAADIRRFLNNDPVTAGPPGFAYRAKKFVRKHKGPVLAAVAVLVTLLSGLTASTVLYFREKVALRRESAATKSAQQEAAISDAVYKFIIKRLFGAASPDQEPDRNLKVRTVLDRGAESVGTQFSEQPLVEATVRTTLAESYQALGEYREALQHSERSRQSLRELLGPDHPDTLASQSQLAQALISLGRFTDATTELTDLYARRLRRSGQDDTETIRTQGNLALCLYEQGKLHEAETQFRKVLALEEKISGVQSLGTLAIRRNLARVLNALDRPAEAESEQRTLIKALEKMLGPEHPQTLSARFNLATYLDAQRKFTDAEKEDREVFVLRERVLGKEHPHTLSSRQNLALTNLQRHGKAAQAEAEFRQLLEICERAFDAEFPLTLSCRQNLAMTLFRQQRYDDAIAEHETVLEARTRILGPNHPDTLESRYDLALALRGSRRHEGLVEEFRDIAVLRERILGADHRDTLITLGAVANALEERGRHAEAEVVQRKLLEAHQRTSGPEHQLTLHTRANLATTLSAQGRFDEAETAFRELLEICKRTLGPEHPDTLKTQQNLVAALFALQQYERAEVVGREAVEIKTRTFGAEHPSTLLGRDGLASVLTALGRGAEALEEHRAVLTARERAVGPDDPATQTSRFGLANALQSLGKNPDAETEYRIALESMERILGSDHPKTLAVLHNLALNLRAQNRLDEAWDYSSRAVSGAQNIIHPAPWERKEFEKLLEELGEAHTAVSPPKPNDPSSKRPHAAASPNLTSIERIVPSGSVRPGRDSVATVLIPPTSTWKWLHPLDGEDPEKVTPGFHRQFAQADFDDSKWNSGKDSDGPNGGFGYGLSFAGVNIGKPDMKDRHTAYFRHTFKTTRRHANLELRCRRDDGIIVYLDGKVVVRDNMEPGDDAYLLHTATAMGKEDEGVVHRYSNLGELAQGPHILAISVHNTAQPSSDLRLGGVTLVELGAQAKSK